MAEQCRLKGKCNRCGACCILMCKSEFMLDENGVCKLMMNGQGMETSCAIHEMSPTERALLPPEELEYWKRNCDKFPKYVPDQNCGYVKRYFVKIGWPTSNCGYTMEFYDDGV